MSEIIFLGTAGGRMVVTTQMRKSGGMWLILNGMNIVLDPGPGCLLRSVELGLDPGKADCIVISHRHIDHSNDANIMIEAMSSGGFRPKGFVLAPLDCIDGDDPVILKYVRGYIRNDIRVLKQGFKCSLDGVGIEAAIGQRHSKVESYGIKFSFSGKTLGYIADTEYFDGLAEAFIGCNIMAINMVRMTKHEMLQHLTPDDVIKILKIIRPDTAILTHFGMQVIKASPGHVASRIEKESGVQTIAAKDGMRFSLDAARQEARDMSLEGFI
jgi:ribonuclease BN (tRNA processing enzyme)